MMVWGLKTGPDRERGRVCEQILKYLGAWRYYFLSFKNECSSPVVLEMMNGILSLSQKSAILDLKQIFFFLNFTSFIVNNNTISM